MYTFRNCIFLENFHGIYFHTENVSNGDIFRIKRLNCDGTNLRLSNTDVFLSHYFCITVAKKLIASPSTLFSLEMWYLASDGLFSAICFNFLRSTSCSSRPKMIKINRPPQYLCALEWSYQLLQRAVVHRAPIVNGLSFQQVIPPCREGYIFLLN